MGWGPTSGLLILRPKQGLFSDLVLMPEVKEDAPVSDWDGANEDLEMVDAKVIGLSGRAVMAGLLRGGRWIQKMCRNEFPVNRMIIRMKSLGKGIPRHPKILRMMFPSLDGRCSKASRQ